MFYIENIVEYLLISFNSYLNNEALTIFFISLLFKLILLPFSISQIKFTHKNKKLQPKLDKLKKSCGDDKNRLNMETMALYKEYKINPLMGCLPLLAQIPIMISIFNVLRSGDMFVDATVFGSSIILSDSTLLFPLANSLFLIASSLPSMTSYDNTSKYMPLFMGGIMFYVSKGWPIALHIFMISNSILTLLQQMFVQKIFIKED